MRVWKHQNSHCRLTLRAVFLDYFILMNNYIQRGTRGTSVLGLTLLHSHVKIVSTEPPVLAIIICADYAMSRSSVKTELLVVWLKSLSVALGEIFQSQKSPASSTESRETMTVLKALLQILPA